MASILAIAPHPDDETLGCGGSLLKHIQQGDQLHWLIMTRVWSPKFKDSLIRQQKKQINAVKEAYPFFHLEWLNFKTTTLETIPLNNIIDAIRTTIEKIKPETIYIPSPMDIHSDHQIVFQAVMAVLKPFYMRFYGVQRILACEIPSETDSGVQGVHGVFSANIYQDISDTHEEKMKIMNLYKSEIQTRWLPRNSSSLQALARTRGSSIGVQYAEAFMLIREIR